MTRRRLNLIIGVVLAVTTGLIVLLTLIAARPAYRFLGAYAARPETPNPFYGQFNEPAFTMTILEPAIVQMPATWNRPDSFCMVMRIEKGTAPTNLEFHDDPPQIHWDDTPSAGVIFQGDFIFPQDRDRNYPKIANPSLAPLVRIYFPYRVNWLGDEPIAVYDNQPVSGVLCYHFVYPTPTDGKDVPLMPFLHRLTLRPQNVSVLRRPFMQFRYNSTPAPDDPPEQVFPQRIDMESYLKRLAERAPDAVVLMTQSQIDQQATESALGR